jgi:hypothetical protein
MTNGTLNVCLRVPIPLYRVTVSEAVRYIQEDRLQNHF